MGLVCPVAGAWREVDLLCEVLREECLVECLEETERLFTRRGVMGLAGGSERNSAGLLNSIEYRDW